MRPAKDEECEQADRRNMTVLRRKSGRRCNTDLPAPLLRCDSFPESEEECAIDRIDLRIVFGMPLHPEGKA